MKSREEILAFLKANPNYTIGRVAHHLKISEMDVTLAQKWSLRNLDRQSPAWGLQNESVIKK